MIPPPVLPAQAPTNIRITRIVLENTGHTLNNIGPGLGAVGPTGNFDTYSYISKAVMIFDMLAGRLEVFPLLLLFKRDTWRKF